MRPARVKVVLNQHASRSDDVLRVLHDVFGAASMPWGLAYTQSPRDGMRLAASAAEEGYDCVAACGGDGTVMEVAAGLVGSDVPMAILPSGTGNVSAMELGIPPELADAARLIVSGDSRLRAVDMGRVGVHTFMLRMGVGFEAALKANTDRNLKRDLGALAYVLASIPMLLDAPTSDFTIVVDGQTVKSNGIACIVANSGLTGLAGISLAEGISVSDGLLDVLVVTPPSLQMLAGNVAAFVSGEMPPQFDHWAGRVITVMSSPTREVTCDGEDAGTTPVTAEVIPGAVRVLVPK
jgi:diacylglycerol kinase (ATP)